MTRSGPGTFRVLQHHITAPTPRKKYHSPSDEIMLEDESGRVRLVGKKVDDAEGVFVTGP